jgi:hypothetical protein
MMTTRQRRWLAGALGTGLLALLLLLAVFDNLYRAEPREATTVRAVELYEPPPPAPPPARPSNARSGGSAGMALTVDTRRAPIALDAMQLDVKLAVAELGALNLGGLGEGFGIGSGDGTGDGSGTGFGLVTLSELDQQPTVLSAPVIGYPSEAVERGLDEFELLFHIIIDEEGRTYPVALLQNPFPSLNADFLAWAAKVRFSPPTRLGVPARTEHAWSIKVKP